MRIVAKSDRGLVRQNNQDSYAAGEFSDSVAWAVVCDGMGGVAGGNIASSTAVRLISEKISSSYRDGMSSNSIKNMLFSAITAANIEIFDKGKNDIELNGMGTTVVATLVFDNTVCIAHAGDSRAYVLSRDSIRQITRDHSVVQELVDKGVITPFEAKADSRKNLITRALGVDENIEIDFNEEYINKDDILLICSDGLTNFVSDEEICELTDDGKFNDYADRLIDRANENGGGDNITVVTISF